MVWFNYRRVPAIAYRASVDRRGAARHGLPLQRRLPAAVGRRYCRAPPTWRMDPALAGSGVADDLLTHLLDTALYLNGPISEGVAMTRTFAPNRQVDDAVVAMVKFENGSAGTFEATRFGIGCKNHNTFQIHGSGGHAAVQPGAAQPSRVRRRVGAVDRAGPARPARHRPEASDLRQFLAARATSSATSTPSSRRWPSSSTACRAASDFHPDFADALAVQQALDALQQSARTRQWVAIPAR